VAEKVYHVELRQFPHNMCRFNLSAQELRATVLEPWAQDRWLEFGERKWSPHQAKLTVLEGPRIPFGQLTMGRGWRTAQRDGREVTTELLAALGREPEPERTPRATGRETVARPAPAADAAARAEDLAADALGLELLARIGSERAPLRRAWELAGERHPGSPPSATLALAERAVESLLRARLIVLLGVEGSAGAADEAPRPPGSEVASGGVAPGAVVASVPVAIASWADPDAASGVWMRRT
jgi:hypothetical protein